MFFLLNNWKLVYFLLKEVSTLRKNVGRKRTKNPKAPCRLALKSLLTRSNVSVGQDFEREKRLSITKGKSFLQKQASFAILYHMKKGQINSVRSANNKSNPPKYFKVFHPYHGYVKT